LAELSMPLDHSPRILRRAISMPSGITVPIVASGTRMPGSRLEAPQAICSASPSPASTSTRRMRSASGVGPDVEHLGNDDALQVGANRLDRLDRQAQAAARLGDQRRVVGQVGELGHPGQNDSH
jgi:hypothetical protein